MKAAMFEKFGSPLVIKDVPVPKIRNNQVLVKVAACGVCYTDVKIWKGLGHTTPLPHVLGHEVAGTIAEVGENTSGLVVGDRVVVYLYETCGKCRYCQMGRDNECINRVGYLGSSTWGGYEEYIAVRGDNALKIPSNLSFEEAAPLADAALTPYHAIVHRAQVRFNDTVLLVGMGGLALTGLQILKLMGARVVALSRSQSKLDMAQKLGADFTINTSTENAAEMVKKFTAGYGVDHVLDFVGTSETLVQDVACVARGGKILLLGYNPGEQVVPLSAIRGFRFTGGSSNGTRQDLRDVVLLASERKLKSIVTKVFSLDEANVALDLLSSGRVDGRVILKVS